MSGSETMRQNPSLFATATVFPALFFGLAIIFGGIWIWVSVIFMVGFAAFFDEFNAPDTSQSENDQFATQVLPLILAILHFILLGLGIGAIAFLDISVLSRLALFISFGLYFGTISHSNAHELIHRTNKLHFRTGKWIFISMLFGHHTSAHLQVHHRYVATDRDPNSARLNESLYSFLKRASVQEFRAGLVSENARLAVNEKPSTHPSNPYWQYCLGGLAFFLLVIFIAGVKGALAYIALCTYAQLQMLMIDYVQHYGLRRKTLSNGKFEPVSALHSWNAPYWYSSLMTLNAPRHSDHHTAPTKPYTALNAFADTAPQLPYSMPFMATVALWPKLWRKVMNPLVVKWQVTEKS